MAHAFNSDFIEADLQLSRDEQLLDFLKYEAQVDAIVTDFPDKVRNMR